jgi:predicted esterase
MHSVRKHSGDPNRIYLVGVSQGGAMVNLLVAKCSQRIAAAVSSCGWMPKPLDTQSFETSYKTPILFLAGSEDQQVPPSAVRQAHDVFEAMGHRVEFKVIPGAGHGWHPDKVNDSVWTFLSSAKRSP